MEILLVFMYALPSYFLPPPLFFSLDSAVTVEFLQPVFPVGEDQENVSVCLTIDTPIATPLTVSLEATSLSADGKFNHTTYLLPLIAT